MNRLKERYQKEIVPALMKQLDFKNVMQVPRLQKVVVNIGMGEALDNPKAIDAAVADVTLITGQKPVVTKATKSIANFKLREGRLIGVKVTLRGEKMWSFVDRLMNIVLPRVRDFRGVSPDAAEQLSANNHRQCVFPERHDCLSAAAPRSPCGATPGSIPARRWLADAGSCGHFHARQINLFGRAKF